MAKTKIVNVLSLSALAGIMASVVISSAAFAAVDSYTVKVGDSVFEYNTKDLQESFLASKAGNPAVLYSNFTAKLAQAKEFYAFHDAKTSRYIGNENVTNAFLADRANFKLNDFVESDKAVAVANLPQVVKSVTVVGGEIVLTDKQTSAVTNGTVASVKAVDINKVEVKFTSAVDTAKATFAIKRGAATYASSVTWNDAKNTATLTAIINLPAADYTVEVSGLTETKVVQAFKVVAETASSVEVLSTTATLKNNDTISFVVKNQYGKAMATPVTYATLGAASVYNVTQGKSVDLATVAGKSEIALTNIEANAKLADVLRLTISYQGLTAQANLTVVQVAASDVITLGAVVLAKDDVRLNVADKTVELSYTVLDQFGNAKKLQANQIGAAAILKADDVQFVSSKTAVISGFATDANGKLILTVAGEGTAIITAIANKSGVISTATITVEKNEESTVAVINAPTMIVAAKDAEFKLAVALTDQYGTVVKSNTGLTAAIKSDRHAELAKATAVLSNDGKTLTIDLSGVTVTATRTAVFEIKRGDTVIGSVSFNVEPNAEVSYIQAINFGAKFEVGAEATLKVSNVVAIDQYGRKITPAVVKIAKADATDADLLALDVLKVKAGLVAGTQNFTVTADGKTKALKLDVVASDDVKSYALDEMGTIYKTNDANYFAAPVLVGKTATGDVVHLVAGKITLLTSNNTAVAKITNGQVQGVVAGEATITAWNGATQLATIKVTVSAVAPVATAVEFIKTTMVAGTDIKTMVEITDQYGVAIPTVGTVVGANTVGTRAITFITENGIVVTETITFTVAP